jgi:hypothetical protein
MKGMEGGGLLSGLRDGQMVNREMILRHQARKLDAIRSLIESKNRSILCLFCSFTEITGFFSKRLPVLHKLVWTNTGYRISRHILIANARNKVLPIIRHSGPRNFRKNYL